MANVSVQYYIQTCDQAEQMSKFYFFSVIKLPGPEGERSPLCGAEVKNALSYT
jgi:hypothetical protein